MHDHEKAHIVLSLVAETGYLEPRDLFVCQTFCPHIFVSPAQQAISWKNTRERFLPVYQQQEEGASITFPYPKKDKPSKLASTTFAKRKLKLTDDDLYPLDYEMRYNKMAHAYFPFYLRKHLYERMFLKFAPDYLPTGKNKESIVLPRSLSLYHHRFQYLLHIFSFLDTQGCSQIMQTWFIRRNPHTRSFLLNGKNNKQIHAYARRLSDQSIYATLKQSFPNIPPEELSTLCAKLYDNSVDIHSVLQEHRNVLHHRQLLHVRRLQIESSPFAPDLHRIINTKRLYDVYTNDFAQLETYVQHYKRRESEIEKSPLKDTIMQYACIDIASTLDTSMEELTSRAHAFLQRKWELQNSPWKADITLRYPSSAYMDLNVPLSSWENRVREIHERRALLASKLREKNLELRSDSTTCRDFIEKYRDDIEQVVSIMEEMNWFYRYTNYAGMIRNYYKDLRDYYNSSDSDSEEEYNTMRKWKSRGEISEECKSMAFSAFWELRQTCLEEFDKKYPAHVLSQHHLDPSWSNKKKQRYLCELHDHRCMRQQIHAAKKAPLPSCVAWRIERNNASSL